MKKFALLLVVIHLITLSSSLSMVEAKAIKPNLVKTECKGITNKEELVRRGCCSWHSSVCGCSGGTAMCCDGTPSPTCGCKKDSQPQDKKPLPEDNAQ